MEDNFDVYYGTICHVCKKTEAGKYCSGCRLVQYCGNVHQKDDWSKHKRFCKCIQTIMSKTNGHHVFEEASAIKDHTVGFWNSLRTSVIQLVELMLKRPLTTIESQMLLFPPVCNVCHCYSQKMIPCFSCNSVMYCDKTHLDSDLEHRKNCKSLELSFKLNMTKCIKVHAPINFSPLLKKILSINDMPSHMELLLSIVGEKLTNEDYLLSEHLSYAMTLLYSISKISGIEKNTLTIHIVGADGMEVLALETLPNIIHFLPNIVNVQITLIGPNLPPDLRLSFENHSKLSFSNVNSLYHDYSNSEHFRVPDVVAVFNCGFSEFLDQPDKDIWKKSLPVIIGMPDCLIILTSYTEKEAVSDLKRLCKMGRNKQIKCDALCEREANPFSSLYPHRDWEVLAGGVFYVNKYISVLKT